MTSPSAAGTLQNALHYFGSAYLTRREQAIVQMILQGHSNQSISDRLRIALTTTKLHRKNAYRKLDISSQSELFHLFIDAVSSVDSISDEDPLVSYMGKSI